MELAGFLPSTENLYKFLFIGGIVLIVFSFTYPLEKKQSLELEINTYNKEADLLNNEIHQLDADFNNLVSLTKRTKEILDSSKIKKLSKNEILLIQESYNNDFNLVELKKEELKIKSIVVMYNRSRIEILQNHIESFSMFRWIMLGLGTIFTVFGLIKWYNVTRISEKIGMKELEKWNVPTKEN